MKRTRKNSQSLGLWGIPQPETKHEIKRVRRPKEDGFIERHKGKDPLMILREFLQDRKQYVKTHYPEHSQVVLFELELYSKTLERLIKNLKK